MSLYSIHRETLKYHHLWYLPELACSARSLRTRNPNPVSLRSVTPLLPLSPLPSLSPLSCPPFLLSLFVVVFFFSYMMLNFCFLRGNAYSVTYTPLSPLPFLFLLTLFFFLSLFFFSSPWCYIFFLLLSPTHKPYPYTLLSLSSLSPSFSAPPLYFPLLSCQLTPFLPLLLFCSPLFCNNFFSFCHSPPGVVWCGVV